jgi:hypothetical protein
MTTNFGRETFGREPLLIPGKAWFIMKLLIRHRALVNKILSGKNLSRYIYRPAPPLAVRASKPTVWAGRGPHPAPRLALFLQKTAEIFRGYFQKIGSSYFSLRRPWYIIFNWPLYNNEKLIPTRTSYFMLFSIHKIPFVLRLNDIATLRANDIFHDYSFLRAYKIATNSATIRNSSAGTSSKIISLKSLLSGERIIFLCLHVPSPKYSFSLLYRFIVNCLVVSGSATKRHSTRTTNPFLVPPLSKRNTQ